MSDILKPLTVDVVERARFKVIKDFTSWFTSFAFLNQHNGFRPGKLHAFIGTTGGGKSTLMRSILIDALKLNPDKRVGVYLSEESKDDLRACMSLIEGVNMDGAVVISEIDSKKEALSVFKDLIATSHFDLIFIDNITTSLHYNDQKPDKQFQFVQSLKELASKSRVPIVMIAHTAAGVSDNMGRLINENDIRGSKSVVNLCEYLYILQRFKAGQTFFPTVTIKKSREFAIDKSLFWLKYEKAQMIYSGDLYLSFEDFKKIYKNRNAL